MLSIQSIFMKRKQKHEKTTHEEINRTVLKLTVRKFKITMNNILKAVALPNGQLGLRKSLATSGDNFGITDKVGISEQKQGILFSILQCRGHTPSHKELYSHRQMSVMLSLRNSVLTFYKY